MVVGSKTRISRSVEHSASVVPIRSFNGILGNQDVERKKNVLLELVTTVPVTACSLACWHSSQSIEREGWKELEHEKREADMDVYECGPHHNFSEPARIKSVALY